MKGVIGNEGVETCTFSYEGTITKTIIMLNYLVTALFNLLQIDNSSSVAEAEPEGVNAMEATRLSYSNEPAELNALRKTFIRVNRYESPHTSSRTPSLLCGGMISNANGHLFWLVIYKLWF